MNAVLASLGVKREAIADVVDMTPEMASDWLEKMRFPGQRRVREAHVTFLAEEMQKGNFRLSSLDIRTLNGADFLVNGQHRLHAVVRADMTVPMVVIRKFVHEFEEVAQDYAAFDRGLIRSHIDGMMAYGLDAETGLTASQIQKVGAAVPIIRAGFQSHHMVRGKSTQDRVEMVREWAPIAMMAFATIGDSNMARIRKIYNAAAFAVALTTFRFQPERAEAFWTRMVMNDGLRQGDPELALIDYIVESRIGAIANTKLARAVAVCWNAGFEHRVLKLIKVHDPIAPIKILGTPFDGKAHVLDVSAQ